MEKTNEEKSLLNRKQRRTEASQERKATFQEKLKKIRDSKDDDGAKRRATIKKRHEENKVRSAARKVAK